MKPLASIWKKSLSGPAHFCSFIHFVMSQGWHLHWFSFNDCHIASRYLDKIDFCLSWVSGLGSDPSESRSHPDIFRILTINFRLFWRLYRGECAVTFSECWNRVFEKRGLGTLKIVWLLRLRLELCLWFRITFGLGSQARNLLLLLAKFDLL